MNDPAPIAADATRRETGDPIDIESLVARVRECDAKIGVIGLGYVGLPLLCAAAERGFMALGFDIDRTKVERLNGGGSYLAHISPESIAALRHSGNLAATDDFSRLGQV